MSINFLIEAITEAIIAYSGYHDPASDFYRGRNPGGLRATSTKHKRDENGNRVFNSFLDGLQALLYEVELKLTGKSRDALATDSTLTDFAIAFGGNKVTAAAWSKFLRKALQDADITPSTELKRFLQ